jgi:cytochrome c553
MAEATFAEIVKGYREGKLPNPVMQNIARRLTDQTLARYFATATP